MLIASLSTCLAVAACRDGHEVASYQAGAVPPSRPAPPASDTSRPPQGDPDSLQPGQPWSNATRYLATLRFADQFPSSETQAVLVDAGCAPTRVTIAPEQRSRNLRSDDFRGTVRILARITADRPPPECAARSLDELGLGGEKHTAYLLADGAGGAYWMFQVGSAIAFTRRWRMAATADAPGVPAPMARWWPQGPNAAALDTGRPFPQIAGAWIVCAEGHCAAMPPADSAFRREP